MYFYKLLCTCMYIIKVSLQLLRSEHKTWELPHSQMNPERQMGTDTGSFVVYLPEVLPPLLQIMSPWPSFCVKFPHLPPSQPLLCTLHVTGFLVSLPSFLSLVSTLTFSSTVFPYHSPAPCSNGSD